MRASGFVIVLGGAFVVGVALASAPAGAGERPGVAPETPWSCPATHPIKGYVSVESGRRVYYVPRSPFYEEASPERCYASEEEARGDGSRRAPESIPPSRIPGVVHERDGGPSPRLGVEGTVAGGHHALGVDGTVGGRPPRVALTERKVVATLGDRAPHQ